MSVSVAATTPADAPHDYQADVAQYRQGLRRYLRELDWADDWRTAAFTSAEDLMTHDAQVLARLARADWSRYGWPREVGGLGGDAIHRAVYYEELANAMLPAPAQHSSLEVVGPAIIEYAPDLAAQFLPGYLTGKEWWGQCFSEPESGSDLASLRCKAVEDADGFVVSGQKIWTSAGPTATRFLLLARTGILESRHRGLSMFLVDADTPGITVRPIALASGRRELAEVFYDDVRVPRDRLVGEVGAGWAVSMYLMQFERGVYGYAVTTKMLTMLGELREEMVRHGASAADRQRFAKVYVDVIAAQARVAITVRKLAAGHSVGPDSSIDKLLFAQAEREVNDLIFDVRRPWMVAGIGPASREHLDTARAEWWYSRAATIMGGTAQIQRGIVADHLLGLPREARK
ncbi:acyl-CoA dehydrogenase family protein [Mycobacterium sp.]|uniref:acyl-CoA dehydrogenase family protein n=1 Tax=Mycobacterium sp. TaxID=1785 RepID=UPI003D0FEA76